MSFGQRRNHAALNKGVHVKRALNVFIALLTFAFLSYASADVSMISNEPSAITPKEAAELALKGEQVAACTKVTFNQKNGRQKPVKGASVIYVKGLPKHDDSASLALVDGKPVYSCKTKEYSVAEGKFKNN